MEQKAHSPKFLKQRKFMMALPLLVIPFLTILFVALGGGKGSGIKAQDAQSLQGLNLKLPDAHFKKGKEKDKLSIYEEMGKDSDKIREAIRNDPYYHQDSADKNSVANNHHDLETIFENSASKYNQKDFSKLKTSVNGNTDGDPNAKKIMEKLAQLKKALNKKTEPVNTMPGYSNYNSNANPDIDKLQHLMSVMKQNHGTSSDPELDQINGMLDKVMDIQHPERLQDSMKTLALKNKPQSFAVSTNADVQPDTSWKNGFYGLSEETDNETARSNSIEAVVEEDQMLVSGAVIKLRLLQDIYIHGSRIAKDQLIYGIASLSNERLKISIAAIRSNDNILPVSLDVYDMDGLQGIYIPGSINRDVSKQSADDALSGIGLTTLDPSLGAQAASAGIQAAKTLISKKVKLVRVSLKAGYLVLLKDNNQK